MQVSNTLAEVTFKGTLTEINEIVAKIESPVVPLQREHYYPKLRMVKAIREKTGLSLLDCKYLAEELIELDKTYN